MGLPQNLLDIPRGQELPLHVYLSVFIPETGQWVAVDPTWDAALKHPIICPTLWDGINATKIAVKPIKTFTDKQTDAFYSSITPEMEKTYMKENKKFLYAFSDYLEKLRK
ncbi:MAG: hypothetical protein LBU87_04165 [Lactobacillales bacterium]|nr:hypothetical protein [Lactobacillales bacterium]